MKTKPSVYLVPKEYRLAIERSGHHLRDLTNFHILRDILPLESIATLDKLQQDGMDKLFKFTQFYGSRFTFGNGCFFDLPSIFEKWLLSRNPDNRIDASFDHYLALHESTITADNVIHLLCSGKQQCTEGSPIRVHSDGIDFVSIEFDQNFIFMGEAGLLPQYRLQLARDVLQQLYAHTAAHHIASTAWFTMYLEELQYS